jgi:hypothetical protein
MGPLPLAGADAEGPDDALVSPALGLVGLQVGAGLPKVAGVRLALAGHLVERLALRVVNGKRYRLLIAPGSLRMADRSPDCGDEPTKST